MPICNFGLGFLKKLKPCRWRYNYPLDDEVEHFGFIAQEVDSVAPKDKYAFTGIGDDGIYFMRLYEFIGPIVKAIQELDQRLTDLEQSEKGGSRYKTPTPS